jgi:hypothetical protein
MSLARTEWFQKMQIINTGKSTEALNNQADSTSEESYDTELNAEEIGGFKGPEPTRYGDWEKNGRCIDF